MELWVAAVRVNGWWSVVAITDSEAKAERALGLSATGPGLEWIDDTDRLVTGPHSLNTAYGCGLVKL